VSQKRGGTRIHKTTQRVSQFVFTWVVECRGEKQIFFLQKNEGKSHLGDLDIDGSVILKLILTVLCADWFQLAFVNSEMYFGWHKRLGSCDQLSDY
jgi:hypothetical protein